MISLALNPYVYCAANPIRFIDPTGCIMLNKDGTVYINETDRIVTFRSDNVNAVVGYAYTSNNKCIEVLINKSDKKGYDTNCHGFSFLQGAAWINKPKDVYTIIKNEYRELKEGETVQEGDIILYESVEYKKKESSNKKSDKKRKIKITPIHSAVVDSVSDDEITERYVMAEDSEVKKIKHDEMERSYREDYKELKVTFLRKTVNDKEKK